MESAPEQGVQGWRTRTSSRSRGCTARSPIFGPSRARRARAPPPPAAGTSRESADSPGSPGGGRRLIGSPRGRRRGGPRPGYWPPADPLCRAVAFPSLGLFAQRRPISGLSAATCGGSRGLPSGPGSVDLAREWAWDRGAEPGAGGREGGAPGPFLPGLASLRPLAGCAPPRALEPGDRTAPGRALAWKRSPAVPCSTRAPASPPCRSKALFLLLCKPKVFIVP